MRSVQSLKESIDCMMFQFNFGSGIPNQNPFNEDFIKNTRRKKLASWIVRQIFTGFFVWLLRDRSWIDIAITIWIITASLSLITIIFISRFMNRSMNHFASNLKTQSENHQKSNKLDHDDFVDVEVIED